MSSDSSASEGALRRTSAQASTQNVLFRNFLETGAMEGLGVRQHMEQMAHHLAEAISTLRKDPSDGAAAAVKSLEKLRSEVLPLVAEGAVHTERIRSSMEHAKDLVNAYEQSELRASGLSCVSAMRHWRVVYEVFLAQMREEASVNTWADASTVTTSETGRMKLLSMSLAELSLLLNGMTSRALMLASCRALRVARIVMSNGGLSPSAELARPGDARAYAWLLLDAVNCCNAAVHIAIAVLMKTLAARDGISRDISALRVRDPRTITAIMRRYYLALVTDDAMLNCVYPFLVSLDPIMEREASPPKVAEYSRFNSAAMACVLQIRSWGGFSAALRSLVAAEMRVRMQIFQERSPRSFNPFARVDKETVYPYEHVAHIMRLAADSESSVDRSEGSTVRSVQHDVPRSWARRDGRADDLGGADADLVSALASAEETARVAYRAPVGRDDSPIRVNRRYKVSAIPDASAASTADMSAAALSWLTHHHECKPGTALEYVSFALGKLACDGPFLDKGVQSLHEECVRSIVRMEGEYFSAGTPMVEFVAQSIALLSDLVAASRDENDTVAPAFFSSVRDVVARFTQVRAVLQHAHAGGMDDWRDAALRDMGFVADLSKPDGGVQEDAYRRTHSLVRDAFLKAREFFFSDAHTVRLSKAHACVVECMQSGVGMWAWKALTGSSTSILPDLFASGSSVADAFAKEIAGEFEAKVGDGLRRRNPVDADVLRDGVTRNVTYAALSKWALAHAYIATATGPGLFPDASFAMFDSRAIDAPAQPGLSGEFVIHSMMLLVEEGCRVCEKGATDEPILDPWGGAFAYGSIPPEGLLKDIGGGLLTPEIVFAALYAPELVAHGVLGARFVQDGDSSAFPVKLSTSTIRPLVGTRSQQLHEWLVHQVVASQGSGSPLVQNVLNVGICKRLNRDTTELYVEQESQDALSLPAAPVGVSSR